MFVTGRFRPKEQIDEVDPSPIHRFILNRRRQARKDGHRLSDRGEPGVGKGDALADTGATNPFALLQSSKNNCPIQLGEWRGDPGQFVQQCLFAARTQPREDQIYHA